MIYLVEFQVTDNSGTRWVRLASGEGFTTGGTDTPAYTEYEDRVIDPGVFRREVARPISGSARSRSGYGAIRISNADGAFDYIKGAAIDQREIIVRAIPTVKSEVKSATVIFSGYVGGFKLDRMVLEIYVRDAQELLAEKNLVKQEYAGINLGISGLEGTTDALKGNTKPLLLGSAKNITPARANAPALIYQVSVEAANPVDISVVYGGGNVVTRAADYASLAALQATAPTAGTYRAYPGTPTEGTFFRLGSSPTLALTCDAQETPVAALGAEAVARAIALRAGLDASRIDSGISGAPQVGVWAQAGEDPRAGDYLDLLVGSSLHGYWIGTRTGGVKFGFLREPEAPAVAVITDDDIVESGSDLSLTVQPGDNFPVWKVTVRGARNYTPLRRSDMAEIVSEERKAYLEQEWRSVVAKDADILLRHPLAESIEIDTALINIEDMQALANLLLRLYGTQRDEVQVVIPADEYSQIDVADSVLLVSQRLGFDEGKLFRVDKVEDVLVDNTRRLTLWG